MRFIDEQKLIDAVNSKQQPTQSFVPDGSFTSYKQKQKPYSNDVQSTEQVATVQNAQTAIDKIKDDEAIKTSLMNYNFKNLSAQIKDKASRQEHWFQHDVNTETDLAFYQQPPFLVDNDFRIDTNG